LSYSRVNEQYEAKLYIANERWEKAP